MIGRLFRRKFPEITVQEAAQRLEGQSDAPLFIDVRETWEFATGFAPGATNIPLSRFRQHLAEIPRDREVLVICFSGHRSPLAVRMLLKEGYTNITNVHGGMWAWRQHGLKTVKNA